METRILINNLCVSSIDGKDFKNAIEKASDIQIRVSVVFAKEIKDDERTTILENELKKRNQERMKIFKEGAEMYEEKS